MENINVENERLKRRFFSFLSDARGKDPKTVDKVAAALAAFESSTKWKPFGKYHIEQAKAFKRQLGSQVSQQTGKPLGKGTVNATLAQVKSFFVWLADQPGFRSRISYSDAAYLNPTRADRHRANAPVLAKGPTLRQFQSVVRSMPTRTIVECRNRAVVAFAGLTGARSGASATLRLKHFDVGERLLIQDADEVDTKNRKTIVTWLFPVGDDIAQDFIDWIDFLQHELMFGPDDPIFPATRVQQGITRRFEVCGLERKPWASAGPMERVFKSACEEAGVPYFNPHSVRNMLVRLGYELCGGNLKALKAWSQNLGHEQMMMTYLGYGAISPQEQGEIMKGFRASPPFGQSDDPDELKALLRRMLEAEERAEQRRGSSGSNS